MHLKHRHRGELEWELGALGIAGVEAAAGEREYALLRVGGSVMMKR
jgi:hypothetical protein